MKMLYTGITKESNPVLYWILFVMVIAYGILIVKLLYNLFKTIREK